VGGDVYETMWGPSEFGPVTGRLGGWDVTGRLAEITVPAVLVTGGRERYLGVVADFLARADRAAQPGS
jgi:hypothetical protein